MTPEDALESYRRLIGEDGRKVFIRRYTGTGPARTSADTPTQAFVRPYGSKELIGAIAQGNQSAIMLVDGLAAILPLRRTDKLVPAAADGTPSKTEEWAIKNPMKREVGGVLVAYELHTEG
jgi:hypothetical protein